MNSEKTLSKQGFHQLQKVDKGESNRDVVEQYLIAGGEGVQLTDKQKDLLDRWTFADEMMRENIGRLKREQIANLIKTKWNISRAMAFQDMVNAEHLFSSSTPLNKKYRVQLRIEFLEGQIRLAAIANDHFAVANYEKVLQKYYDKYPDVKPDESPKVLIFSFDITKLQDQLMPLEEVDSILKSQEQKNKLLDSMSIDLDDDDFLEEEETPDAD